MRRFALIVGFVIIVSWPARGAQPTLRADLNENWQKGGVSAVVAQVKQVKVIDESRYHHRLTLIPRATISGAFDCGANAELTNVDVYLGPIGSSVIALPKAGDIVLTVITPVADHYAVVIDSCTFMPGGSALVKVEGLDDPKVQHTLRSIQVARTGFEEPKASTTRPR